MFQIGLFRDHLLQRVDGHPLLNHGVAITDGDGVVLQRLVVDGGTKGSADGILAAVAFADAVFFVVLAGEAELQLIHDLTRLLGQPIFFYQRQDGQLYRCQGRWQMSSTRVSPPRVSSQ